MKRIVFFILLIISVASCDKIFRDRPVDKKRLPYNSYRLFQGTEAWELAKAVQDCNLDKVSEIVKNNPKAIDVQEQKNGSTLLMMTIFNNNFKSFEHLLKLGADINVVDYKEGTNALIFACVYTDIKYVEMLLEQGADPNFVETGGRVKYRCRSTPLSAASRKGKLDVVKLLLRYGADINLRLSDDEHALSDALTSEKYEIAYFLITHGADYQSPIMTRHTIAETNGVKHDTTELAYIEDMVKLSLKNNYPMSRRDKHYRDSVIDFLKRNLR